MPRRSGLVAALFAFFALCTVARAADPLPRAVPEEVGFSAARLGRIAEVLRADIERGRLPGAVIAIARHGRLAYFESFGYLDRERGTPMPRDAIFPIASMTKPLTGVAALLLLEEGKLALTDPVARFLPQFRDSRVAVLNEAVLAGNGPVETEPARRPITIEDLMRHTSGLTYGARGTTAVHKLYPPSSAGASASLDAAQFLDRLGGLPLLYQPGTVWEYGLSTDVLGLVVERISGQSLGTFLEARVFRPLGMADSGFLVPPEKQARYARPLPAEPDTGRPQSVDMGLHPRRFECGGGCAVSTAGDYIRFAQMLLSGGRLDEVRILGRKTVEAMTADHMRPEIRNTFDRFNPSLVGYGFGLTVAVQRDAGTGLLGSPGLFTWGGAYGTNFWVDPREDMAVVFMAMTPGPLRTYYRRVINALVYQALTE